MPLDRRHDRQFRGELALGCSEFDIPHYLHNIQEYINFLSALYKHEPPEGRKLACLA